MEKRSGWINVGDLQGAVHFKIGMYGQLVLVFMYRWNGIYNHVIMSDYLNVVSQVNLKFTEHVRMFFYFLVFFSCMRIIIVTFTVDRLNEKYILLCLIIEIQVKLKHIELFNALLILYFSV